MAMSPEEFRRVSMCETAKELWVILEITNEEIRMKDDESFDYFYAKLNDIVNSRFKLGE